MPSNMSKVIFFDAGPVISLLLSRLGWLLPELKKRYQGRFYITPAVHRELVERPLSVRRFEFEALQVMKLIKEGVLEMFSNVPAAEVQRLQSLANSSFASNGRSIDILQLGEMESMVAALQEDADAVVIDERTLRLLVENASEMQKLLTGRFRQEIKVKQDPLREFSRQTKGLTIIRSVELVAVAYRFGLLDSYIPAQEKGREVLLDSVLWATKFSGCAVTEHEIEEIKQFLLKR